MIFKYSQLEDFFLVIKGQYPITTLRDWDGFNSIILRHDVDLTIESALALAIIEKKHDIYSTFFILTSGITYNPLYPKNQDMLRQICEMGFEIGLHFDPSVYESNETSYLKKKVDQEAAILSAITGEKVTSVSLHTPGRFGSYPIFKGYKNAYDKKIFSPDRYISDSRMIFQKSIFQFVELAKRKPIQILLHPELYTEQGEGYDGIFFKFLSSHIEEIHSIFRPNQTYNKAVNNNLLECFVGRYRIEDDK